MKNLLFSTILFASLCLSQLQAQPVAMVKHQPFPYATGLAFDSTTYALTKAKLVAADALRKTSKAAIDSLQAEIRATRKALDDQARLGRYDAGRADALVVQMNVQQGLLATAQGNLSVADRAVAQVLAVLPRRVRKMLVGSTPELVATATVEYVHLLQQRKWKWAGVAGGTGFMLGLALVLL